MPSFRETYPDFIRKMGALRALRDRELAKLTNMPGRHQRSRVRKLVTTPSLHLLYAYEGLRKAHLLEDATPEHIEVLARQCNPLQRCDERGTPHYVSTGSRRRLVTTYGPAKRGRQMMVADLLKYLHPPLEQQFLFRGGMPAAFRAVEAAYVEGFTYGVEVDFVGFYGSVGHQGLAELLRPLPNSVVEHVVWDRATGRDTVVDTDVPLALSWAYPSLNGEQGIALGSACSPHVGERILATLIAPTEDCRTVAYADNILVVGRSPEAVETCVQAMQHRASAFDGWSLRSRMHDDGIKALAEHGFNFLHHEARIQNGTIIWSPDQRKLGEFMAAEGDSESSRYELTLEAISQAEKKVSHWRRAYPGWPEGDLWEVDQLAALAARRYYMVASPLHRTLAVTALISSYYARGRQRSLEELAPVASSGDADRRRQNLIDVAQDRLILMARRNGFGPDAIRYVGDPGQMAA